MPHLVNPIHTAIDAGMKIEDVLANVQEAHEYLSQSGMSAVANASNPEDLSTWGTQMKRVRIVFTDKRPELISSEHSHHSLIEVINQCATMERLIDALAWCVSHFSDYRVVRCHPTTSSDKVTESLIPDNDIVLANTAGHLARFEVSDVSSNSKDGNGKERKDLSSMGVQWAKPAEKFDALPESSDRLFMAVSAEFGNYFRKRMVTYYPQKQPHFRYQEHEIEGNTSLFEVLPPV